MPDPHPQSETDRLKALEEKLKQARGEAPAKRHQEEHYSQAQHAWRMVTELVAGLLIGFGIGYGLDALLGTKPWLMVLFIFLGFAAGVKTMMRSAQEIQERKLADLAGESEDERRGD